MLTPSTTYEAGTTCNYNGIVYRIGKMYPSGMHLANEEEKRTTAITPK